MGLSILMCGYLNMCLFTEKFFNEFSIPTKRKIDETGSFRTTASSTRNKSSVSVPCRASKSLRISVMRDIKSAQKLKTALLKSKSDDEFKSFGSKQLYTMGRPDEKQQTTTATTSDIADRTYLKTHSAQKYLAEYDKIHGNNCNNQLSDSMSSGASKKGSFQIICIVNSWCL